MGVLQITRFTILLLLSLFSLPPLVINAHFFASMQIDRGYTGFILAVGVLTIVTAPTMIIVEISKRGAWISRILVELLWLDTLGLLWLLAAMTASPFGMLQAVCVEFDSAQINQKDEVESFCAVNKTTEALSWVCFVTLTLYTIVLCIRVRRARRSFAQSGSIWAKSVRELEESASGTGSDILLAQKGQDFV